MHFENYALHSFSVLLYYLCTVWESFLNFYLKSFSLKEMFELKLGWSCLSCRLVIYGVIKLRRVGFVESLVCVY